MNSKNQSVTVVLDAKLRSRLERIKSHGVALTAVVGEGLERRVSNWEARLGLGPRSEASTSRPDRSVWPLEVSP